MLKKLLVILLVLGSWSLSFGQDFDGPMLTSWNVNGGWNLNKQVEWMREGKHVIASVHVPTLSQNAEKPEAWQKWWGTYGDSLLKLEGRDVVLRSHNFLTDFTEPDSDFRVGPFEGRPTVYRKIAGGFDDGQIVDPFGPVENWSLLGEKLATSHWMTMLKLKVKFRSVWWVENNEPKLDDPKGYVDKVTKAWKPNLEMLSVRLEPWAAANPPPAEFDFTPGYAALRAAIKKNVPWPLTTGGYNGDARYFDHPSVRLYDDVSGIPVEAPKVSSGKAFAISVWQNPGRTKTTLTTPAKWGEHVERLLWQTRPEIVQFYAGSTHTLETPWIDPSKQPPGFAYTYGDYWYATMDAVEEIWADPRLLRFWRDGVADPTDGLVQVFRIGTATMTLSNGTYSFVGTPALENASGALDAIIRAEGELKKAKELLK